MILLVLIPHQIHLRILLLQRLLKILQFLISNLRGMVSQTKHHMAMVLLIPQILLLGQYLVVIFPLHKILKLVYKKVLVVVRLRLIRLQ